MNDFLRWIRIKCKVDARTDSPPYIREGEVWWCSFGKNVDAEIDGKSRVFTRPVIILKKFGARGFLGIPTTTKRHTGSWHVPVVLHGNVETVVLNQMRTLSCKRLHAKIGTLSSKEYEKVKDAFLRLLTE